MVSLQTISQKVDLGKAYYAELIATQIASLKAGECYYNQEKISCLNRLIRALTWDINREYNTPVTQRLYELLLNLISTYSGSFLPFDPDVIIPGQTVIVEQGYVTPVKVFFNSATPGIMDWQGSYASTFGNDPTLAIYLPTGSPNQYALYEGVSPTLQFDNTNTLLQSFYYDLGVSQTGYILIST